MIKKQIEEYVDAHRQELIDAISKLVRIPSLKGDPSPGLPFGEGPNGALETALSMAGTLGFSTTNYDGYIGAVDFSDKETALDILAHLDVVPAPPEEWTVCQPFEPLEKDGKLYGRGSSDDKGPAICSLFAMKTIKALNIPLKKNVRLLLGTDEESGSEDIAYYYKNHKPAPSTFSPDANFPVINVEKGRLSARVTTSYPDSTELPRILSIDCGIRGNVVPDHASAAIAGLDSLDGDLAQSIIQQWMNETNLTVTVNPRQSLISVKGVGGHAAHPDVANNALTGLIGLLAKLPFASTEGFSKLKGLSATFPHGDWAGTAAGIAMSDDVSDALTVSLNILHLNETGFTAQFDSRTPICSTKENTCDVVESSLQKHDLSLELMSVAKPHHVPVDSPFVQTLLKAYEEYSGQKGYGEITGGGTYVHGLNNAVAFGASLPGTDNNIHGADEFAVIDELLLSTKIFAKVIVDLCS